MHWAIKGACATLLGSFLFLFLFMLFRGFGIVGKGNTVPSTVVLQSFFKNVQWNMFFHFNNSFGFFEVYRCVGNAFNLTQCLLYVTSAAIAGHSVNFICVF